MTNITFSVLSKMLDDLNQALVARGQPKYEISYRKVQDKYNHFRVYEIFQAGRSDISIVGRSDEIEKVLRALCQHVAPPPEDLDALSEPAFLGPF